MMLKSHEKFHSTNGKRKILIVDDEMINRAILGEILQSEYEPIFATDGLEALEIIKENSDTLSVILLDLMMPVMSGIEVIKALKADAALQHIPVIVLTSDQEAEIESLDLGAIDFIPKPYPQAGVILARVRRTIELSEDRDIIQSTERDPLTGLYNREYFYRYAEQYDLYHKDVKMDAIVVDINHFHMINERFGTAYGDKVLRRIGEKVREIVGETGGIVCRREADVFMVYCPHGSDYKEILDNASTGLTEDSSSNGRVRLRMGVYEDVDKTLDIERRFDRAKMAADTVRNSFARTIGIYDSNLHDRELYAEQLIEDFHPAVAEKQFTVFFQPKFDIRHESPVLASAEALVRWKHPRLGMISPGVFIPLFEDNGLIQELDGYVWRETAAQIRLWKERLGFSVPVSVNMSRIDMYDPNIIDKLCGILEDYGLTPRELLIEITESAYTQDSEQIIETVSRLRDMGFKMEMDDFGTGYSSLNMISTLPIDALKLDMQFIRSAFSRRRDTRMLKAILNIAAYLSVPVIAEGVETEEQLSALRSMGCDLVQGYYFSRPVPAEEFEPFLIERRQLDEIPMLVLDGRGDETDEESRMKDELDHARISSVTYSRIIQALAADYFCIYYVDLVSGRFIEYSSREEYRKLDFERGGEDFFEVNSRNIMRTVYDEDRDSVLEALTRDNIRSTLSEIGTMSLTYRMIFDGVPTYVNLKATSMGDGHVVIGISNVDAQVRREHELAVVRERAYRDALTGVKSKYAFAEAEKQWNEQIEQGCAAPFAVAFCDVNGLKNVNDTQGHKAGDSFLREACHIICEVFRHSPVFRIGGDEFAAILSGSDYEIRDELISSFTASNAERASSGGTTIACGLAEFRPESDRSFEQVFERADAAMYVNKDELKLLLS